MLFLFKWTDGFCSANRQLSAAQGSRCHTPFTGSVSFRPLPEIQRLKHAEL